MIIKAQAAKGKIDKLKFNRIRNICASKDTTEKIKRQATKWGKIFANHISDKGLVSQIQKELLQLNNKKESTQFFLNRQKI